MFKTLFLSLALAGTLAAPAQAKDRLTDTETSQVETARTLGAALYAHDQAAWHATDRALEELDEAARETLRGYTVVPAPDGKSLGVSFRNAEGRVVWTGRVKGSKVKASEVLAEPRELLREEALRIRAVDTAVASFDANGDTVCAGRLPMNTAVIEDPESDDLFVYLLTPMRSMNEAVFGRHHRFRISADGREVLDSRTYTNSCAVFPAGPTNLPRGAKPVGIVTNHILDDLPQETHLLVSLQHDQPVFVMAGERLFKVDKRRTRVVDTVGR